MTTFDDIDNFSALLNSESDEPPPHLGLRHLPISQSPEPFLDATLDLTTLAQSFQNVRLGSSSDQNNLYNQEEEEEEEEGEDAAVVQNTDLPAGSYHPLRPNAEDCMFYLRTGTCKFGPNCRYNHPLNPSNQVGKEDVLVMNQRVNNKELLPQLLEQIECKYYLTSGGCKYGDSCRYRHSKTVTDVTPLELNFIGLPIRLGAKVCPFYMRNGSCGYGPRCKFTHPNPTTTAAGVYGPPHSPSPAGLFVAPVNGTSQQAGHANWSLPMMTGTDVALHGNNLSYMPPMPTVPHFTPEWNGFKAPEEWTLSHSSAPVETSYMTKPAYSSSGVQEYPERPGQPECVYFIKTGNCKFKSACKYHHPSSGTSQAEYLVIGENGLPLRPGRKICRNYEQYGICKFGQVCLFDHPVNLRFSLTT